MSNTKEMVRDSVAKWLDLTNKKINTIDVTAISVTGANIKKDASYEQIIAAVTDKATGYLRISR
jgi:hypothetical protein